jgi:hypothetical protein
VIAIIVLLFAGAAGWFIFTQLRARRLGLPPPSFTSYLPWHKEDDGYGPPQPAPGGVVGWFNDQFRKLKNRNNRSAAGAYEQSGASRGRRASRSPTSGPGGRNPFDDDAAATSLRGVSPRPIDTGYGKPKNRSGSAESSPTERRSVFRENM